MTFRVVCGVNWQSDVDAGELMGSAVFGLSFVQWQTLWSFGDLVLNNKD